MPPWRCRPAQDKGLRRHGHGGMDMFSTDKDSDLHSDREIVPCVSGDTAVGLIVIFGKMLHCQACTCLQGRPSQRTHLKHGKPTVTTDAVALLPESVPHSINGSIQVGRFEILKPVDRQVLLSRFHLEGGRQRQAVLDG